MDIAAFSMGMSQAKAQQDASIAVMKMAMDTTKTNAAGLTEMLSQTKSMEMSIQPNIGGNLDIRI
ncbi:YjfB family protein [Neobacillus cucumis]|nr:YjfB family protein [Neobacillus cucumis]